MEAVLFLNCKGCDKPFEINITENDFGIYDMQENQPGSEIKYFYLYMSDCDCENVMWIQIDVSKYPEGMLKNYELTYDGINNFHYDYNFMQVINSILNPRELIS